MNPRALAELTKRDLSHLEGDLRELQDTHGVGTIELAALLLEAHRLARRPRVAQGSVIQRLLDSDAAGSLPFAEPLDFEPDRSAPKLGRIGTIRLGNLSLPRFGLGCMRALSASGVVSRKVQSALGIPTSPEATRHALLNAVKVSGVRMLDIARGYGAWPGAAEGLLRDWFGTPRFPRGLVVASKVGYRRKPDGSWFVDLDPAFLRSELRESAAQLGGTVPLMYLVVRSTPSTPVVNRPRQLSRALTPLLEAQRDGLIDHLGVANVTADELDVLSDAGPVDIVQNRFSLHALASPQERAVLDRARALKLPFVTWGLFGEGSHRASPPPVVAAAKELDVTEQELTIALLLALAPNLVPLPGAARRATIESSIEATRLRVPPAVSARLLEQLSERRARG